MNRLHILSLLLVLCSPSIAARAQTKTLGEFDGRSDVGNLALPGESTFNNASQMYTLSGGGTNMWFAQDDFHFVWKKLEGDVSLAANIAWPSDGKDAHRKACLLIRQTLDADACYADAVVHGDGLCSIQYRETKGENTHEIQSGQKSPKRIRIEKRGEYVSMSIGDSEQTLSPSGGTFRIHFDGPFYVGLGVCSHNRDVVETAVFSNVVLKNLEHLETPKTTLSTLEFISVQSTDRRVVYHTSDHIEAPNWTPDGASLIYNGRGRLYRVPVTGGVPSQIDCGTLTKLNNDHGISPDGTTIAVSDETQAGGSRIYTLPMAGGKPKLITEAAPSYWHGWSPDGKTLAYCAKRGGDFNIFTIPAAGGMETQLTTATGLDDGPDYSPDGRKIYFNSSRSGTMQIWSMNSDGGDQQQMTMDEYNNWFPHPSPDGKSIVFLSYEKGVVDHPANKDVQLRIMQTTGGAGSVKTLAKLFGGQGTINVPSWSPDSRRIAFVSYQPAYK